MAIHTYVRQVQDKPPVNCDLCGSEAAMYEVKASEPVVRTEAVEGETQDEWTEHRWFLGIICTDLVAAKEDAELYERIEDHNHENGLPSVAALTAWREMLTPGRRRLLP